jgi:chlorobactene glucosyltransferase
MILFFVSAAWLGLVIGLSFILWVRFRAYTVLRPGNGVADELSSSLAVIVPVRNEAATIARCLAGLLAQSYPRHRLRIVVVDDDSTDGTAPVVRGIAQTDSRVTLLDAGPLPTGWVGKPHACWIGAQAAGTSEWLCFVDADTCAAPEALRTAVGFAEAHGIDMLSLHPFQELGTIWERLVIPEGFLILALSTDMRRINDPTKPDAAANGQFYIIRRQVYDAIGGHAAVRTRILEDMALARAVKERGYHLCLMGGNELVFTRMYSSLPALWEGVSKMAAELVARSVVGAAFVAGGMLLLGWMPVALSALALLDIFARPNPFGLPALVLALTSWAVMAGIHLAIAMYFKIPPYHGFLFPLGFTLSAAATLNSAWRRLSRRNTWKGRLVDPHP